MKKVFDDFLKKPTIISLILKFTSIPMTLLIAKITSTVVNVAYSGNISKLITVGAQLLLVVVLFKTFDIFMGIFYQKTLYKSLHSCKISQYNKFLSNPLYYLFSSKHGRLIENFNDDFNTITNKKVSLIPSFVIGILTLITYFIFLCVQDYLVALILFAISFIQIIPPFLVRKYMQYNYDYNKEIEAKTTDYIITAHKGFSTIKLYNLKKWWLHNLRNLHKEYIKAGNKVLRTNVAEETINKLIENILKFGTYAILGLFVIYEKTSLDVAIQAIALSSGFFNSVKSIFSLIPQFSVAKVAEKRFEQLFCVPNDVNNIIKSDEIIFSNIDLSYENKQIISDLSISFKTNRILIKGDNGIGKTSLLRLLTGLCCAEKGNIKIDNIESKLLADDNFPRKIFYLPQSDSLFNFTAIELYEMVIPNQINLVLNLSNRFRLTKQLLYETKIKDLSGGERKKIFLSLAFVIDPMILLLDEPTNSLDYFSKKVLFDLIEKRKKSTIIVSHDSVFDNLSCYFITLVKTEDGNIEIQKQNRKENYE